MKCSEQKEMKGSLPQADNVREAAVGGRTLRERGAQKAYELFEKRGRIHGCDVEDWLRQSGWIWLKSRMSA